MNDITWKEHVPDALEKCASSVMKFIQSSFKSRQDQRAVLAECIQFLDMNDAYEDSYYAGFAARPDGA